MVARPAQRVGFMAEFFVAMLPVVGWFRWFMEDIFVWRSFKQDQKNIENNISSFHKTQAGRLLFMSPEGAIVDYDPVDMQYVADCQNFCRQCNVEPFEYLLTPRYKGLTVLGQHSRDNNVSVTMAYVSQGQLLNERLFSPKRVVPDIFTTLRGGLSVHTQYHYMGGLEASGDP